MDRQRTAVCAADGQALVVLHRDTGAVQKAIDLPGAPDVVMHDPGLHHVYIGDRRARRPVRRRLSGRLGEGSTRELGDRKVLNIAGSRAGRRDRDGSLVIGSGEPVKLAGERHGGQRALQPVRPVIPGSCGRSVSLARPWRCAAGHRKRAR